jgi:hypothetical protein
MKQPIKNLFDISCPQCGGECDLLMLDQSDPTPRTGFRYRESEDGMSVTEVADPGEWIPLGPWWIPDEFDRVKAFCAGLGGMVPVGIPVWCYACGYEASFEDFDGDLAVRAAQIKALQRVIGKLFSPRK